MFHTISALKYDQTHSFFYPQNGFNPIWESCTEFKLVYPELTFIELQVKTRPKDSDVDSKSCDDPLIGHLILPYTLLRQGYR